MKDPTILKDLNYSESYWQLWPTNVDEDISKINIANDKENHCRKERYQRPLCILSKSKYIMFTVLILGAAVHSDSGEKY